MQFTTLLFDWLHAAKDEKTGEKALAINSTFYYLCDWDQSSNVGQTDLLCESQM